MPRFDRYIGIDYSGAKTPTESLKGPRVYMAGRVSSPTEVLPPPSPRKYWTRRGVAEWLLARLSEGEALQRSIRRFGAIASNQRVETPTSTTPIPWPPGCAVPISMEVLQAF
jgi:hypothetical protein